MKIWCMIQVIMNPFLLMYRYYNSSEFFKNPLILLEADRTFGSSVISILFRRLFLEGEVVALLRHGHN